VIKNTNPRLPISEIPLSANRKFNSAQELIEFLNDSSRSGEILVYRGEAKDHPVLKPNLFRCPPEEQLWHQTLMLGMAMHLLDDYLRPHLQWDHDGPRYKDKWIGGDLRYAESYQAYPQSLWPFYQIEAVLQHYGWRTHGLDVTVSPSVAVFFASLDFKNRRILREGQGMLYCWRRSDLWDFNAPVVDLAPISDVLSGVFNARSSRPQAQEAAIIRLSGWGREDESFRHLKERAEALVFDRTDAEAVVQSFDYYFPPDGVLEELLKFEQLYLHYCLRNRNQFDEAYVAFIEARLIS
jgi:hypothetical protein